MNVLITLSSRSEQAIFPHVSDHFEFMKILVNAKNEHYSAMYAFCLMPDYCAIVAQFRRGESVREFMRYMNRTYLDYLFITYAARDVRLKNHIPVLLHDSDELFNAIEKVERQPVIAGIVMAEAEYPYSSAYYRSNSKYSLEKVY